MGEFWQARFVRVVLLAAIGYSFFIFHGLESHLGPWSQSLINAVVKYGYTKQGQDDITVVLFREENLADLKTSYPVPYRLHADIIEALASYSPSAVFVDFAFIDNRDSKALKDLGAAFCMLRDNGSKVFVAAPLDKEKMPGIASELLACASPALPEMDGKTRESGILTYFHGQESKIGFVPTAGFALAAESAGIDPAAADKLEIIWGKGVAPLNLKWMDCEEKPAWEQLYEALLENPLVNKLDCPYHRTLSVSHLLNSVGDADVEKALQGKTIFYGAGFRFTGDRIESPVYGQMPGVYLHAMAYDNLLTFGQDYKHADRHGWRVRLIDLALLLTASWLLVFVPVEEKTEAESLIELISTARKSILAIIFSGLLMAALLKYASMDIVCLAGALLYVFYRSFIQGDKAFGLLVAITLATSLFCFYKLNLGPRNILAFVAFFEIVGHIQEKLIKQAKTYHEIRNHYLTQKVLGEEGGPPAPPFWDHVLCGFFWIFQHPANPPEEHKS